MNWRDEESNPKILQHSAAFCQRFDHGNALQIERKISHLNIAFDRYASIGTAMHYNLVTSLRYNKLTLKQTEPLKVSFVADVKKYL